MVDIGPYQHHPQEAEVPNPAVIHHILVSTVVVYS